MNQAGIPAQVDVFSPMPSVLNEPVPATQVLEPLGCPDLSGQTRDAIAHLSMLHSFLPPGPLDPEDLRHTWPIR